MNEGLTRPKYGKSWVEFTMEMVNSGILTREECRKLMLLESAKIVDRQNAKIASFRQAYGGRKLAMSPNAKYRELFQTGPSSERIRRNEIMRTDCHFAPDQGDIERNQEIEPEGERLRRELTDWLRINKIVSIMLDTDEHCVSIDIAKLPPKIKPVLKTWGSIFVKDVGMNPVITEESIKPKPTRKFRPAA